jgi:hypothetical protein
MTKETKINKEKLEYLKKYIEVFARAYYLQTYTKLTSVDQLIDVIKSGKFTFEDVFFTYIDNAFKYNTLDDETEIYWEDNMSAFDCNVYFPEEDKLVNNGAWIKVRNETGFEIHYAKVSNRKRRFSEELETLERQLTNILKGQLRDFKNPDLKLNDVLTPKKEAKKKLIENKIKETTLRIVIGLKPYGVKINRTKSKCEYLLPHQYELVEDIEEFSNAYIQNLPGIGIKTLYTSINNDAIFYLQSRGISKKVAEMMSALQQVYFTFNMEVAMEAYNNNIEKRIKIVTI